MKITIQFIMLFLFLPSAFTIAQDLTIRYDFINGISTFILDGEKHDKPEAGEGHQVRVCIDSINPFLYKVVANAEATGDRFSDPSGIKEAFNKIMTAASAASPTSEDIPEGALPPDAEIVETGLSAALDNASKQPTGGDDQKAGSQSTPEILKRLEAEKLLLINCADVLKQQNHLLSKIDNQIRGIKNLTFELQNLMKQIRNVKELDLVNAEQFRSAACRRLSRFSKIDCDSIRQYVESQFYDTVNSKHKILDNRFDTVRTLYKNYRDALKRLESSFASHLKISKNNEESFDNRISTSAALILKDSSLIRKRQENLVVLHETFGVNYWSLTSSIANEYESIMRARFVLYENFTATKSKLKITLRIQRKHVDAQATSATTFIDVDTLLYEVNVIGGVKTTFSRGLFLPVFFQKDHYKYLNKEGVVTRGPAKTLALNAAQFIHFQPSGHRNHDFALSVGIGARISTEALDWRVLVGPSFIIENDFRLLFHTGLFAGHTQRLKDVKVGDDLSGADAEVPMESAAGFGWFLGVSFNFPD